MTDLRLGVLGNVDLKLDPVVFFVADPTTEAAHGKDSRHLLDLRERFGELDVRFLLFFEVQLNAISRGG